MYVDFFADEAPYIINLSIGAIPVNKRINYSERENLLAKYKF